jgi:hypothetical protein
MDTQKHTDLADHYYWLSTAYGLTPSGCARARQVFLGEGKKLRDPGPEQLRRHRGDAIFFGGLAFWLFIRRNPDIPPFFPEPLWDEEDGERDARILGERIELGLAFFSLELTPGFEMPPSMLLVIPHLRREMRRMRREATVRGEISASARRRAYHSRRKGQPQTNAAFREGLAAKIADSLNPEQVAVEAEAISTLDAQALVGGWLAGLPAREREALERLLNDMPDRDAADKQARWRAMRRLRALSEADPEE